MSTIPVTILDNFLENPDFIRKWGMSLEYNPDPEYRWPGKRTSPIIEIHPPFYYFLSKRILNLFFEELPLSWDCDMRFQSITNYKHKGWVHQDASQITSIIYLTPPTELNCGTSLYNLKTFSPFIKPEIFQFKKESTINHHKNKELLPTSLKYKEEYETAHYIKTLDIKDQYNRLICFPGSNFHSANFLSPPDGEARLTLIMFFSNITYTKGFPVYRSKQTLTM